MSEADAMMETDVLVLGAGVAGLSFALELVELDPEVRVLVLAKSSADDTSTAKAQGGIAAVLSARDNPESHHRDTMTAGVSLNNPGIVDIVVREGPGCVERLAERGV